MNPRLRMWTCDCGEPLHLDPFVCDLRDSGWRQASTPVGL